MSRQMEEKIAELKVVPVVVLEDAKVLEQISKIGIVPVVKIDRAEDALPLAKALCAGGLPCAEVTFRTAAAKDSIKAMSEAYPEMLVGAGTVLTKEQVDSAVEAGAKFIVSPGFDPEIVDYCLEKEIPVFPGCITPSEVAQAVKRGLRVVKFFPAYLACKPIVACGGSWMVKKDLIEAGEFDKIRELTKEAVSLANEA